MLKLLIKRKRLEMILSGWSRDVGKHYVIGCACYIDARGFSVSDAFKPITVTDLATFTKKIVGVDAAPGYLLSSTALLNLACLFFSFYFVRIFGIAGACCYLWLCSISLVSIFYAQRALHSLLVCHLHSEILQ